MEVSRGGYYDWKKRLPSQRVQQRQRLDAVITTLFEASKKRFGSPKITRELMKQGWRVSESHVARRMRELGLRSIVRRPNQVWVSDLTYLRVGGGWLYLVVFIDLYSRRVVGWELRSCLDHTVVLTALQRAVARRQSPRGLVIHSDRGVQYACTDFTKRLARHGFM